VSSFLCVGLFDSKVMLYTIRRPEGLTGSRRVVQDAPDSRSEQRCLADVHSDDDAVFHVYNEGETMRVLTRFFESTLSNLASSQKTGANPDHTVLEALLSIAEARLPSLNGTVSDCLYSRYSAVTVQCLPAESQHIDQWAVWDSCRSHDIPP
jgi:hypothetical protein